MESFRSIHLAVGRDNEKLSGVAVLSHHLAAAQTFLAPACQAERVEVKEATSGCSDR